MWAVQTTFQLGDEFLSHLGMNAKGSRANILKMHLLALANVLVIKCKQ